MRQTDLRCLFRTIRRRNKINQAAMASKLGVKQPLLSFYENGRKNIPEHIIEAVISEYKLNSDEANLLRLKRIARHNLKAIDVLEQVKEQLLINNQYVGYIKEFIEEKINQLKK